jgi:arylsulfatase A-like enzyme
MSFSRRSFLLDWALAAAADRLAFAGAPASGNHRRPNVIVIMADDLGWRDVGYHGSEVQTPNLDRIAAEGVELDNFHSYPTCSPTRCALLTGRPPSRFGIRGPLQYRGDRGLPAGAPTLASHFRGAGYDTAICGKWHLGMRRELGPNHYGFRHSYGYTGPWIDSYTHLTTDWEGTRDGIQQWHRNGEPLKEEGHVTDLLTAEAVRFVTAIRDKAKPFFLYLPFSAPHTPCQEEARWVDPYNGTIGSVSRRYVAAAITHMDDSIGRVREALRREGIEQETIIFFHSDNGGPGGGDNTRWLMPPRAYNMSYGGTETLSDNRPLRGGKGQLYEGGIRVPALLHWPGRLKPRKLQAPLLVCDVWPTLAAATGVPMPVPSAVEGRDEWRVITGEATPTERVMYWADARNQAVRRGRWKLIHFGPSLDEGRFELYDLEADPYETNDAWKREPQTAAELRVELSRQVSLDAP